jgi:hypothetical protein
MADGTEKPIEQIRIGDLVMAFDPAAQHGRSALTPSRVTRTFQNTARIIVDLRGTRMTPGHVCLTGDGTFATIAAILAADGSLVEADGTPIRARTGAPLASPEDALVAASYPDPTNTETRRVTVRAGIPCGLIPTPEGGQAVLTLAQALAAAGLTPRPDGTLRDAAGAAFDTADWPPGTTPLDTPEQQDWVVAGPDGQPYTPDWIRGLEEEAEAEIALGAATRTVTAGPGTATGFRPRLVGGALAAMPTLGASLGRAP